MKPGSSEADRYNVLAPFSTSSRDIFYVMDDRNNAGKEPLGLRVEVMSFDYGVAFAAGIIFYDYLIINEIESKNIIDFGLASENSKGEIIDFFSERLIFPIIESQGNVLGFGGRILSDKNPKYVNTKKNLLFDKGSVLYGLDQALENIRDEDECVLVEGYTDVITAHQFGFKNVIASMGTAITIYQANKISDISNSVVIALDSDQAGTEATLNALDKSCLLYTSPSPRDATLSRMPSSA